MSKAKLFREAIERCTSSFIQEEMDSVSAVSKKMGLSLGDFILRNYPGQIYSFIMVNGDISISYLRDNLDDDQFKKVNGKITDSFIRNVDSEMNKFFRSALYDRDAS